MQKFNLGQKGGQVGPGKYRDAREATNTFAMLAMDISCCKSPKLPFSSRFLFPQMNVNGWKAWQRLLQRMEVLCQFLLARHSSC